MIKRTVAAVVTGALLLGGASAVAGIAGAEDRPATPESSTSAAAPGEREGKGKGKGQGIHPFRRAIHGDLVVRGDAEGEFQSVTFDRGKLVSKDNGRIVIERPDGKKVSVAVTEATKFRGEGGIDALEVGKPTVVISRDGNALGVGQPKPKAERRQAREQRAGRQGSA